MKVTFTRKRYKAGPAIEYALEPVVSSVSSQLFGVSQVGSGEQEEDQIRVLLEHPVLAAATDFLRWAVSMLRERPLPTRDDLDLVRSRSSVLAP